jgi:hypothetical protein
VSAREADDLPRYRNDERAPLGAILSIKTKQARSKCRAQARHGRAPGGVWSRASQAGLPRRIGQASPQPARRLGSQGNNSEQSQTSPCADSEGPRPLALCPILPPSCKPTASQRTLSSHQLAFVLPHHKPLDACAARVARRHLWCFSSKYQSGCPHGSHHTVNSLRIGRPTGTIPSRPLLIPSGTGSPFCVQCL